MTDYYIDPTKAEWAATTAFALNSYVCPTLAYATAAAKKFVYEVTNTGSAPNQSGAAEPTWPTTVGNTVADGDLTWTCRAADSWAKGIRHALNICAYSAGTALVAGDRVFFKYDSAATTGAAASVTLQGPSSGAPAILISADSSTSAYTKATQNSIDGSGAATYELTLDGSLALYGVMLNAGKDILPIADGNETLLCYEVTFKPGDNDRVYLNTSGGALERYIKCDFSGANDTGAASGIILAGTTGTSAELIDCTFSSMSNRTACAVSVPWVFASGCDFSGLPATTEIASGLVSGYFTDCKTAATWAPLYTSGGTAGSIAGSLFTRCGNAASPTYLYFYGYNGSVTSSTSVYRGSGASVQGTSVSWSIATDTWCAENLPLRTPWIYGYIESTGSKTFTIYTTTDRAGGDFYDDEAWIEVEVKDTATSEWYSLVTDHRTITATHVTNPGGVSRDDTTSSWTGSPSFTYKQVFTVSGTANTAGQVRARMVFGVASLGSNTYVDPKLNIA